MDLASRPTNWSYSGTKESETMRNLFPRPDYMETKPAPAIQRSPIAMARAPQDRTLPEPQGLRASLIFPYR